MMLYTLGLAAALSVAPIQPPDPAARPITAHLEATPLVSSDSVTARFAQTTPRDSLQNGARTGAIIGGIVTGVAIGYLCGALRDDGGACWPPVVLWSAIGAGAGALVGAAVDALFERRVAVRWAVRF